MPWATTSWEKVLPSFNMLDQSNQFKSWIFKGYIPKKDYSAITYVLKLGKQPLYKEGIM
jgi:hypothetical protein